jgi:hypothetical protein
MDRLVCGDVGFGKTEVALRAAFAAAISGKQVAVVVPTTLDIDRPVGEPGPVLALLARRDEARELRDVDRQALKPFGKRAKMLAGE